MSAPRAHKWDIVAREFSLILFQPSLRFPIGNDYQTDNLIGKRYAKAYLNKSADKFSIDKKHFHFLVNHGSVGAFTTYKVLLKALVYIEEEDEYTLTPDGMDLVDGFQIPHTSFVKSILLKEKVDSHSKKFDKLGEFFSLSIFKEFEKKQLRNALCANPMRKTAFMLINTKTEVSF